MDFNIKSLLGDKNGFKYDKLGKNISTENKRDKTSNKNNYIIQKRNPFKTNIIIINLLIIIDLIPQILSYNNNKFHFIEYKFSKILLKLNGIGQKKILNPSFKNFDKLKEVYINGISQIIKDYNYFFNETNNLIELIFEDYVTNCGNIFTGCSDVTEIDLSNFDSSRVTNMFSMFSCCTSLVSINFTNFITSQVEQMDYMFFECSSLISLNLSSFDTSKVTDMNSMFSYCSSLSSLDLSYFSTPKVKSIVFMFFLSPNLEYINLNNFNTSSLENFDFAFSKISDNPVVCMNEKNDFLLSLLQEDINCYTIDCSNNWKSKQKKKINAIFN